MAEILKKFSAKRGTAAGEKYGCAVTKKRVRTRPLNSSCISLNSQEEEVKINSQVPIGSDDDDNVTSYYSDYDNSDASSA